MKRFSPRFLVFLMSAVCLACMPSCSTTQAPRSPHQPWEPPATAAEPRAVLPKPAEKPLGLSELLNLAYQNNPSLRESWQNARAAAFSIRQAQAQYYPQAEGSLSASISQTDVNMPEGNVKDTPLTPKASLTWLLLDLGGRAATIDQAHFNTLAANFLFNKTFLDVRLAVERAYYGLYSAQAGAVAAEINLQNSRTNLDAAQKRFDAGLVTQLEVLQAQANYDDAVYTLDSARGSVQDAIATLAQSVGIPADSPLSIVEPPDTTVMMNTNNLHTLIADALAQRPDLAAQRANVKAKEAALRSARSDLWPTLNAGASAQANRHNYSGNDTTASVNDNDYTVLAYLALQWNFFDGFLRLNRVNASEATLEAERARLLTAEINAASDVWTNYYALQTALKKLQSAQALLASSEASYQLALEAYGAGLKSLLDLLQANTTLADARNKLIGARRDVQVAQAGLLHALGIMYTE
jgi:outer membrane protein